MRDPFGLPLVTVYKCSRSEKTNLLEIRERLQELYLPVAFEVIESFEQEGEDDDGDDPSHTADLMRPVRFWGEKCISIFYLEEQQ